MINRNTRGARFVLVLQPNPRDADAFLSKIVGDKPESLMGQIAPVDILQEKSVIRCARFIQQPGMVPQGLDRRKAHDCKGQDDQGGAGQCGSQPPAS